MAATTDLLQSSPSPTFVLSTVDVPVLSASTLTVNFFLESNIPLVGLEDPFGNPFSTVTSLLVTINSDTTTLTNNQMVVQSGGYPRTYQMAAGESVDFDISFESPVGLNINYYFTDAAPGIVLSPQGNNILNEIDIRSVVFNDTALNFSQGTITSSPARVSVSANNNLSQDYKLNIRIGYENLLTSL